MSIKTDLEKIADEGRVAQTKRFFTEMNDRVIGVTVPEIRKVARKHAAETSFADMRDLMQSKVHEYKYAALEILVFKYQKATVEEKDSLVTFYLSLIPFIDNWDLVDTSAYRILGDYLSDCGDRKNGEKILRKMVDSENIWERRIAIVSTYAFIKTGRVDLTLDLAKRLVKDKEDLIHKACGWMLREAGKRDKAKLEKFLTGHKKSMPRTMLRYAIEKFRDVERRNYLEK